MSNPLPLPKFVFIGNGTRIKLNHPKGTKNHWAPKRSYYLNTMLDTIANSQNKHIKDEVRKGLLAKGYILVVIGGGIIWDVECSDTHVHHLLKKKNRELEAELIIGMLRKDPNKIPSPSQDDIMKMLSDAWNSLDLDVAEALKQIS